MSALVAIVGRPNVGKSTLFNRLVGERKAIVEDISGVTRDRNYGNSEWNGMPFDVVDTGGFVESSTDVFEKEIKKQVLLTLEEASIILLVVDVTTGITSLDDDIVKLLRKSSKPCFLIVNKVDNDERLFAAYEFLSLGFERTFNLSAITGSGSGELLDELVNFLPKEEEEIEKEEGIPTVALIGRPNVGKSSLFNLLLGEERSIVTNIAGTTRDMVLERFNKFGKTFDLVDTAGVRKKAKVKENVEFYSVMRSIKSIDLADIVVLMLDARNPLEAQDLNLLHLAESKGKGIVLAVNKWDLINKDNQSHTEFTRYIKEKLRPFDDVPILFVSVLEKDRVLKLLDSIEQVYENLHRRISTSKLNDLLLPVISAKPPPSKRGKNISIKYVSQIKSKRVNFAFFSNHPKDIDATYKRFLENILRKEFEFTGVPVNIYVRKK